MFLFEVIISMCRACLLDFFFLEFLCPGRKGNQSTPQGSFEESSKIIVYLYLFVFCTGLLTFRHTDGAECLSRGRTVVGALRRQV